MAYIGNQVTSIPFITDTFSGTGGQTAFTLTRAPAGTASIAVFISGVYQAPSAYTLSGTTLNFVVAPSSGTNNIVVLHLGNGSTTQVPSDGSVTLARLASDTYAYINAAFATANSDTSTSNSAAAYANSGFAVANSAASYANSAFAVANNGVGIDATQNTNITNAGTYANSAFAAANAATATDATQNTNITSAASYANSGFSIANSAFSTANGRVNTANTNTFTGNQTFTVANVTNQLAVFGFAYQNIITLTDAATITANLAQTNNFVVTLGGNRTMANATNITAGQSGFVVVRQDGTGSRTLTFGTGWRFPGNTAPTLTTTASAVDLIVYTARDSGNLVAQAVLNVT